MPKPIQLPSGSWHIYLRREKQSVTAKTPEACTAEAIRIRKQWEKDEAAGLHIPPPPVTTLETVIENYIASRKSSRSPSTIEGYEVILRNRFPDYMQSDVLDLDTQQMIDDELDKGLSPKTVKNSWALVSSSLRYAKIPFEMPCLPRVPKSERRWLDYNQVLTFLSAIRGSPYELAALLALHSLRKSELFGLRLTDYDAKKQVIHVRGALLKVGGEYIRTDLNKNDTSRRDIPIIIPRLSELLKSVDSEYIVTCQRNQLYKAINTVCQQAGLPLTGVHGLRHSFASLAYHLNWKKKSTEAIGGWRNSKILEEIYTHNADLQADVETMRDFFRV